MASPARNERGLVWIATVGVSEGDTLAVPKFDKLARYVPDARATADQLETKVIALNQLVYGPTDPWECGASAFSSPPPGSTVISSAVGPARSPQPDERGICAASNQSYQTNNNAS